MNGEKLLQEKNEAKTIANSNSEMTSLQTLHSSMEKHIDELNARHTENIPTDNDSKLKYVDESNRYFSDNINVNRVPITGVTCMPSIVPALTSWHTPMPRPATRNTEHILPSTMNVVSKDPELETATVSVPVVTNLVNSTPVTVIMGYVNMNRTLGTGFVNDSAASIPKDPINITSNNMKPVTATPLSNKSGNSGHTSETLVRPTPMPSNTARVNSKPLRMINNINNSIPWQNNTGNVTIISQTPMPNNAGNQTVITAPLAYRIIDTSDMYSKENCMQYATSVTVIKTYSNPSNVGDAIIANTTKQHVLNVKDGNTPSANDSLVANGDEKAKIIKDDLDTKQTNVNSNNLTSLEYVSDAIIDVKKEIKTELQHDVELEDSGKNNDAIMEIPGFEKHYANIIKNYELAKNNASESSHSESGDSAEQTSSRPRRTVRKRHSTKSSSESDGSDSSGSSDCDDQCRGLTMNMEYDPDFDCDDTDSDSSDTGHSDYDEDSEDEDQENAVPKLDTITVPCPICQKVYANKHSLKIHTERYHNTNSNDNINRNTKMNSNSNTNNKNELQKSDKQIKINASLCSTCGKVFRTHNAAYYHEYTHRPVKCKICDKTYTHPTSLQSHMDAHNDITYECGLCGKSFNRRSFLNAHVRVHIDNTRKVKIVCPICGISIQRHSLARHQREVHDNIRRFICEICSKAFANITNLKIHLKGHAREEAMDKGRVESGNKTMKDKVTSKDTIIVETDMTDKLMDSGTVSATVIVETNKKSMKDKLMTGKKTNKVKLMTGKKTNKVKLMSGKKMNKVKLATGKNMNKDKMMTVKKTMKDKRMTVKKTMKDKRMTGKMMMKDTITTKISVENSKLVKDKLTSKSTVIVSNTNMYGLRSKKEGNSLSKTVTNK